MSLPSRHNAGGRVRGSLKGRLALWVLLPAIVISAVDLAGTYRSTDRAATLVQQQLLKGAAKIISEQLAGVEGGYEISVPPAAFELFASDYHDRIYYAVRSKSGLLIAGDDELQSYPLPLQIEQEKYFMTTLRGEPVRVIAYAHALPSTTSQDYAITQIAQTLHSHDAFRNELLQSTFRDHLILLAIVVAGLLIALRWTLSPLSRLGQRLLLRQPGSLEQLDDRDEPIELAPIVFALNDYVTRLDRSMTAYEQFVANTAHHLRTAFAIVSSQISFGKRNPGLDATQREVLDAIQGTIGQGTRVINQLLTLAALEQERHSQQIEAAARQDLAEIATTVLERLAPLAQLREIELGVDGLDPQLYVAAPRALLEEVISNLIDNAIQHIPVGGAVTISCRRDADHALLRVMDSGPGIAPDQRDKVFERFYQIDSKPNSSGLGLAIVREICDALRATVVLSTPAGGGLQVDVRFVLDEPQQG